jgi:nucleotide-binding universal stress UspA family protein
MYEDILIPTDGSEGARPAIEEAVDLAESFGARVHALFVADTSYPYAGAEATTVDWNLIVEDLEEEGKHATGQIRKEGDARGVEVREEVRRSSVVHQAILEYADEEDVDLVVMGTHGRTGLSRFLLGSVTEKVVRTSPIPVLTVRMTGGKGE